MQSLVLSALTGHDNDVEVVERKGLGHPDTICDALAETLSRNLSREYCKRFGRILHHNVDKALLCGGRALPKLGGGSVLAPVRIYLAGRATDRVGDEVIPLREIAIEGARSWLKANMHNLDVDRHVDLIDVINPGSLDLQRLFARSHESAVPLANDTSFGVAHAPLSPLERLVLDAEHLLNSRDLKQRRQAWGEDVKIMAVRCGRSVEMTIACAMVDRYLIRLDDYLEEKAIIEKMMRNLVLQHHFECCGLHVNSADEPPNGAIFLTVTGTSAEAGDDGEVGRGNRINGLITPCRPMSLEAAAGKNPATHVGKLYNVAARNLVNALIANVPDIAAAQSLIVSRIGTPITKPSLVQVRLASRDDMPIERFRAIVEEFAAAEISRIPRLSEEFVSGAVPVY